MDKNLQYRIKKGYPVVRIAFTLEDAKLLRSNLSACMLNGVYGDPTYIDGSPLFRYTDRLLRDAIEALGA